MQDTSCDSNPPETLLDVLAVERARIADRRRQAGVASNGAAATAGIALSGGGIRSATFCLGVLQELHQRGLLKAFDYLSTVSGGGYVGGWWSALLSRQGNEGVFPPARDGVPERESRPLHHLRLHSNYLIPQIGAFSWDTWRAVTIVGRNLVLTWLVLLPFVLAGITASQLYFLATRPSLITSERTLSPDVLAQWWSSSSPIVAGLITAVGALTFIWLRYQRHVGRASVSRPALPGLGWWAALIMIATLALVYARRDNNYEMPGLDAWRDQPELTILICLVLAALALVARSLANPNSEINDPDLRRNNVAIVQQFFLMGLAGVTLLLVAGGLGHLLVGSAVDAAESWITRAGGVASLIVTGVGAGWTAFQKAGVGKTANSTLTRVVMALTPLLLIITLCALLASLSRTLIASSQTTPLLFHGLVLVSFYGIALAWVYAAYETTWSELFQRSILSRVLTIVIGLAAGAVLYVGDAIPQAPPLVRYAPVALTLMCLLTVARRLGGILVTDDEAAHFSDVKGRMRLEGLVFLRFAAGLAAGRLAAPLLDLVLPSSNVPAARAGAVAVVATAALALITRIYGSGQRRKGLYLLLYAGIVSAFWFLVARGEWVDTQGPLFHGFALVTATATWTLAFGWATDPNNLALHAFYKARLVRAYMGASNDLRYVRASLIDDSVPHDDVRLTELRNVDAGGPYHLINATLNLSGDSSLGSLQRRAAPFVFARDFCGSSHPSCGFRPTTEYMGGGLTLGTTVAISGAAASPEMGSQSPSGAMSMLMTLFNVRLGFWAPMPAGPAWRSKAARFWAFYTLREFLARTGDRASYGFLSDGGHFDNTAVHALLARGNRLIVAVDCGADPQRMFQDFGNLIRRARIDFGAEISLNVDELREMPPDAVSRSAFVVGRIDYSVQHLLDVKDPTPAETTGYLLVIKPSIVGAESLDVRQYRSSYPLFPQQPTTDQFFDEAQFESYRRLGMTCARSALDALGTAPAVAATTLPGAVRTLLDLREKQAVLASLNASASVPT